MDEMFINLAMKHDPLRSSAQSAFTSSSWRDVETQIAQMIAEIAALD